MQCGFSFMLFRGKKQNKCVVCCTNCVCSFQVIMIMHFFRKFSMVANLFRITKMGYIATCLTQPSGGRIKIFGMRGSRDTGKSLKECMVGIHADTLSLIHI